MMIPLEMMVGILLIGHVVDIVALGSQESYLRDKTMKGGKRGENQNGSDETSGESEEESTDPKTPDKANGNE